jgi:hypothetical protein
MGRKGWKRLGAEAAKNARGDDGENTEDFKGRLKGPD